MTSVASLYSCFEKDCLTIGKSLRDMSKVIMGNSGFECQGVSAWWKEKAQTRVFMLSPSLLLNHLKPQSSKPNAYYP